MVHSLKTLKGLLLKPSAWSQQAAQFLSLIDADCPVAFYRHEVEKGIATLYNVYTPSGELVAVMVCRLDETAFGREFVVVAAGGQCAGRLMTLDVLPAVEEEAKKQGCNGVRAHTRRSAVMAGFQRAGYSVDEYILKKAV